jgi:thiamine-monophosphate kinase
VNQDLRLHDIGEQGLLAMLQQFCPNDMIGDDAAILPTVPGQSLVVTTDMLVDGVHFSDRTTSATDVGWRATAANLSDLAAMGADPLGLTVCLGLPGHTSVDWVKELYQGMTACLSPFAVPIVGGDVCRSSVITVAIAAFGQVNPQQAILRSSAQPGDLILATGVHGASRAGLELLLYPDQQQNLRPEESDRLIRAHQRPQPRLDIIPQLRQLYASNRVEQRSKTLTVQNPIRVAGMDSSDGLADAILQICRASKVGAVLDRNQIPIPPELSGWVSAQQALDWALYGGEDFELVLCLPESLAKALQAQLGHAAFTIGRVTATPDVVLQDSTGTYPDTVLSLTQGFQHF